MHAYSEAFPVTQEMYSQELAHQVATIGFAFTELSLSTDSLTALMTQLAAYSGRPNARYQRAGVHFVGDEPLAPSRDSSTTAYVIDANGGVADVSVQRGDHAATRTVGPGKVILVAGQRVAHSAESEPQRTWLKFSSRHGVVAHVLREAGDVDVNLLRLTGVRQPGASAPQTKRVSLQVQLGMASGFLRHEHS